MANEMLNALVSEFGSFENAALRQNIYALQLEQAITEQNQVLQQLAQEREKMRDLLTDPEKLSTYYLALEQSLQPEQPVAQEPTPPEPQSPFQGRQFDTQLTYPGDLDARFPRPSAPVMPQPMQTQTANQDLAALMQSTPLNERWKVLSLANGNKSFWQGGQGFN